MAPEYAMVGHYSVKSDVYSYGVILLEIVSDLRNRFFRPYNEEALLHRVSCIIKTCSFGLNPSEPS